MDAGHGLGPARQAAWLLSAAGCFTIANNYLPGAGHLNIGVLNLIGVSAILLGLVAHLLPWRRWSRNAPIVFAPVAFGLIALGNRFGGVSHYSFGVYFVLAFTWVGLAFPPRTSFVLAPAATIAYVIPGLTVVHGPPGSVSSVTVVIPVCLLVGETIARSMRRSTEKQAAYERLVDMTAQGIWQIDADDRTVFVNRQMAEMLGYRPEDMIGRKASEFVDEDGRAPVAGNRPRRRHGIGEEYDLVLPHKDGHPVFVSVDTRPLMVDGVFAGAISTVADVTRTRQRDAELREAEERFRLAFANAPIGVSITSLEGRFIQVNQALCQMLGRSEDELAGAVVLSLTHPDDRAADREAMEAMRHGHRRTFHTEKRYLHAAGTSVWVRLHASVVSDDAGHPRYFVSQMEDITDYKRAEAALREEQERFRLSFDHAPIGKALVAPDGRLLEVNPALCSIVGYSRDDLLGKTFADITHPDDVHADLEPVRRLLAGEIRTYSLEQRYVHADGHTVVTSLSVSVVRDDRGGPSYFISQIEDISARKAMEAELARLAMVDELTGLRNRRGFLAAAEPLSQLAQRNEHDIALLFIDLDNLKDINDRHGHRAGDEVLVDMAGLLRTTFRESDVLGRLGGDEFAVLIPDNGLEVKACLDRLRQLARHDPRCAPLAFSVGVSRSEWTRPRSIAALIDDADAAMYREKSAKHSAAAAPVPSAGSS